jgi:hypothetical protein
VLLLLGLARQQLPLLVLLLPLVRRRSRRIQRAAWVATATWASASACNLAAASWAAWACSCAA